MRRLTILLFLLIGAPALASELQPSVDEYLEPYVSTGNFQGTVLIARGDEVLLVAGYGMASVEHGVRNGRETVYHIASVSKPFTAAGILLLVDDGEIDLHAPLSDIVPEYEHAEALTVHDLLAHTSGIPNINGFDEYGDIQLRAQTPDSLFEYFEDMPLEFEPGERYSYSNSNYNLLALIVERVSGQSFGDFLHDRVLAPAGTTTAGHDADPSAVIEHRADGYAPAGHFATRRAPWLDWTAKTGNGSMVAAVDDLFLWARAFFGDRLVSSGARELMLTEHTENSGYGWFIFPRHDRQQFHINGRSPGFSSYLGYYPEEDLTIVVLSNLYNSITTSIGSDLAAIVFGEEYDLPRLSAERLSAQASAGVVGRFQYGDDFYNPNVVVTLELRDGHVHQRWGESGFESALIPQGTDRFIDRTFWMPVEFRRDEDGDVVELVFDGFDAQRIE